MRRTGAALFRLRSDEGASTVIFGEPGDAWFRTGDLMRKDEKGYFYFVDRKKDAIRRRGENISSYEVEQVLLSHPDVAAVAVYPVRSPLA